jgi:hypothetical protein
MTAALLALAVLPLAGCGGSPGAVADESSGVYGVVRLGPQCPVERAAVPCAEKPAPNVTVTVSEQLAGEAHAAGKTVAHTTTDENGRYRVAVAPGAYVVTADAGMRCELMDVRVPDGAYARMPISCDTGIQ